eukprot:TRINITY_DN9038_c0_g1_i3.p1 TRINITY_DN9038_c0_g1~~TRINITY_DN9038_c0_g1_i3.p1  ORF type:complete len:318 (-),score=70.52 TRINITY_DN9038_c0_g1_i3:211-1164(-)
MLMTGVKAPRNHDDAGDDLDAAPPAKKPKAYYENTNGVPKELDGRVTHLGVKEGELARRIVSVGSLSRAERLRELLDPPAAGAEPFEFTSSRGFTTFTGRFRGEPVSIVATGMGAPMMDFLVREARAVTTGNIAIIRYGSCGGVHPEAVPGTVVLNSEGSVFVQRNYDAFATTEPGEGEATAAGEAYRVTRAVAPDAAFAAIARRALHGVLGSRLLEGLNVSADSFYGSQGRDDPHFDDRNAGLLAKVDALRPWSMEMESFHLLHLAACSRGSIRACTAAIVAANRSSGEVISTDLLHQTETEGGRGILEAVTSLAL